MESWKKFWRETPPAAPYVAGVSLAAILIALFSDGGKPPRRRIGGR